MEVLDLEIRVDGWTLVSVAEDDGNGFGYTVGLVENYDHPEIVLLDLKYDTQVRLMQWLVEMVQDDGQLDEPALASEGLRWAVVHPQQLGADWFGRWASRYGAFPAPGDVIQVIPPLTWFCACHAPKLRRLDRPPAAAPRRGPGRR